MADSKPRSRCSDEDRILDVLRSHVIGPDLLKKGTYTEEFIGELNSNVLISMKSLLNAVRKELHASGSLVQSAAAIAFGKLLVENPSWLVEDAVVSPPWFYVFVFFCFSHLIPSLFLFLV